MHILFDLLVNGKSPQIFYGEKYIASYLPMLYLLPGILFYPASKILGVDIAARGIIAAASFLTNVIFNIILIPQYVIIGASIASSISYSLMGGLSLYFFIQLMSPTFKDFINIPNKYSKN